MKDNIINNYYVNTEDYSDVVSLIDIFKRYIQLNDSVEGFEEYCRSGFLNGHEEEYTPVNRIADDVCINAAFDIMQREINTYMTDCKFRVKAFQNIYNHLEHYQNFVFVIHDEETAKGYTAMNQITEKYICAYYITYTENKAFLIGKIGG